MIEVELLDFMGSDLAVVNAARVSFNKESEEFEDRDARLLNYLASHKHFSPFCHPQISLRCKAPIFLARQLGKSQVGLTWNEVSRRYVDTDIELYSPDSWRSRPTNGMKQGSGEEIITELPIDSGDITHYFPIEEVVKQFYNNALDMYDMLIAYVAPEQARMVLPQSMMTTWVWTGSLMAFTRVYNLRIESHAQKEAQDFAELLRAVIEPHFPISWKALTNG